MTEFNLMRKIKSESYEVDQATAYERVSLPVLPESFQLSSIHTDEVGQDGIQYNRGIPSNKDWNPEFRPFLTRGLRTRPGTLHQLWLSEPQVRRAWSDKVDGLIGSSWSIITPPGVSEDLEEEAEKQRSRVEEAIWAIEGGFHQFIREAMYCYISGFSLFEVVQNPDGSIKKTAFRFPHTVEQWIFDEAGRSLQGAKLTTPEGKSYTLDVSQILLLRWDAFGSDPEGNSPLRTIAKLVEAKQLAFRLEMLAIETRGAGIMAVESGDKTPLSEAEAQNLASMLAGMVSTENPVIVLPDGRKLVLHSPAGQIPDFEGLRRYIDEQISLCLKSEASLVGMQGTGSYALADSKDAQQIRALSAYARIIEEAFNGLSGVSYTGLIKRMVDAWGGPIGGVYPELRYGLQAEAVDPARYDQIANLVEKGVLNWSVKDEQKLREELGLSPLAESEEEPLKNTVGEGAYSRILYNRFLREEGCSPGCRDLHLSKHSEEFKALEGKLDKEALTKFIDASKNQMGTALHKVARDHRDTFVDATRGVTDPARLMAISEQLRREFLPEYQNAVRGEVLRMTVKGAGSVLHEMGVIPNLPRVGKNLGMPTTPEYRKFVEMYSSRIAKHSYNVTESYLERQGARELDPDVYQRQKPEIPTESAFQKHANSYAGGMFNFGRQQIVTILKNKARDRGLPDEIIGYYSTMLDSNVCSKCEGLQGSRHIVGSGRYNELSPPSVCEGGEACRCIWVYIGADEIGYQEILDEVLPGWRNGNFSQVEGEENIFLSELFEAFEPES